MNYKAFLTMIALTITQISFGQTSFTPEKNYPIYKGKDLGCTYSKQKTSIRVYAPTAEKVRLHVYTKGSGNNKIKEFDFTKKTGGTWLVNLPGNWHGKFYTVQTLIQNKWGLEVTDPYAKAVGENGDRVQIIDLATTNPSNWKKDVSPKYTNNNATQDAVIYELHIRDVGMHSSSGIKNKGKYLGLAEINTKNQYGKKTGLSHIKELGVTHVHLLPVFDFKSIDETQLNKKDYNWGYDPKNYNTPEGSYSTNPNDATIRIQEFKTMVAALHKAGLRVVMDVVYNHTSESQTSNFHQLVPGYYHRMKNDSVFADASACGNETASEMPMMRKFMIESLVYWVKEYHIDGFRFDLMAIHDIETMNLISDTLQKIKPDILIYGEGWAAGAPQLDPTKIAAKKKVAELNNIAVFSDDIRDGIKGYVFDEKAKGFVTGNFSMSETVKFGITGAIAHPQLKMEKAFYEKEAYANKPGQVINYVDCHDNLTLWDKLAISAEHADIKQRIRMHELAYGLILTSQGIPFIHAGSEFIRTKYGVENSYNKPDSINAIDWNKKQENLATYLFIQELIKIRKNHPLFRLRTVDEIQNQLSFLETPEGVIAYTLESKNEGDTWKKLLIVCNASNEKFELPTNSVQWKKAANNGRVKIKGNTLEIDGLSFAVLYID